MIRAAVALLFLVLSCAPKESQTLRLARSSVESPRPEVRFRIQDPPTALAEEALAVVPGSVWDGGLNAAVEELLGLATHRSFSLDPRVSSLVAARAGFPGQVRFSWTVNQGDLPIALLRSLARGDNSTVQMAIGRRLFGDGTSLWMLAGSTKAGEIDPMPRDLELDEPLSVRVDIAQGARCRLFIRPPDGPIQEVSLTNGVARWVDRFHVPGEYRIEVIVASGQISRVAFLFSVFVDGDPPEPPPLRPVPVAIESPVQAETWLFEEINQMRRMRGLPTVERFELFDEVAREHSSFMASYGSAVHTIPGVSRGVPWVSDNLAHPRARHHESVATAFTAADALFLMQDSPGHLDKLLCETCTHASVGVALEPVLSRFPRLFVTVDLLEFPQGPPQKIRR